MAIPDMELRDYCALNRPRFQVDPETDAEWFFGNQQVSDDLLRRVRNDFDVRGVPKFLMWGRYGAGKTHTLSHIKHLFGKEPQNYPAVCFNMRLAPYDEGTPGLGGWKYLHSKMLDAMGEGFLREVVQAFDRLPGNRTADLVEEMRKVFNFGDENLKRSLANVLAGHFLRETRSTIPAWQWLKGSRLDRGSAEGLGTTKTLENAEDMVHTVLNIGNLVRKTLGKGLVFLMDEAHALAEVVKRDIEIHDVFLQLASDDNHDVGFVIAYFGSGAQDIPSPIRRPDVLSRLGATPQNMGAALVDLGRLINTKDDLRDFIINLLKGVKDQQRASQLVSDMGLTGKLTPEMLPFTEDAIERVIEVLFQNEQTRNARMIISVVAVIAAAAYQDAKKISSYVIADRAFVEPHLRAI